MDRKDVTGWHCVTGPKKSKEEAWAAYIEKFEHICTWLLGHKYWRVSPELMGYVDFEKNKEIFKVYSRVILTKKRLKHSDLPTGGEAIFTHNGKTYDYKDYLLKGEMMKTINIGTKRHTVVSVMDEPSIGGHACHEYGISRKDTDVVPCGEYGHIRFQNGPIKETGVNGCHQEDLIAIVIHRLQGFQSGEFKCRENAIAITKLEEALLWLNKRTNDRIARGVEGTHTK